jgi:hypothetical protein
MRRKTEESKVAEKIVDLLNKVDLDLDYVGVELARIKPRTHYNRLQIVAEAAQEEVENEQDRNLW